MNPLEIDRQADRTRRRRGLGVLLSTSPSAAGPSLCSQLRRRVVGAYLAALLAALTLQTPDLTCRVRSRTDGALVRSTSRKHLFWKMTGYPVGRSGYVVDHLVPLACGGCDIPSNMEWLTVEEHKAKSKWERRPCSGWWEGEWVRRIVR